MGYILIQIGHSLINEKSLKEQIGAGKCSLKMGNYVL